MKPGQSIKVLPILYTTLLLLVIYLKFSLIRADKSRLDSKDLDRNDASLMAPQKDIIGPSTTVEEEPKKQVRRLVEIEDDSKRGDRNRPRVKQNQYNFYNSQPPARPGYYRPRPRPSPFYDDPYEYDYDYYYQRPPPPLYPPPPYPQYPYPYPIRPLLPPPTEAPTTTPASTTPDQLNPIGYMLIDTYHTRSKAYSKPIAFFTT